MNPNSAPPPSSIEGAKDVKIVVIGDGAAGKTSMLVAYATNAFPGEYVPSVFDNYKAVVEGPDGPVNVSLWDTAGQEDYERLRPLSYGGANVFLVVFSVMSPASFENVPNWVGEIKHHGATVPMVLVGTKIDQRDDRAAVKKLKKQTGSRPIHPEDASMMARDFGFFDYVECSALSQEGLLDVMECAVEASNSKPPPPRGGAGGGGGGCCVLV